MAELRQACDRCHSKKLRCVRLAATDTCSRCQRANALCVSSPPGKQGRNNDAQSNGFDWTSLLDGAQSPSALSRPEQILAPQEEPTENPLGQGLPHLSQLLESADQLYAKLPGEHLYHYSPDMALQHQLLVTQGLQLQNTMESFVDLLQQLNIIYPAACAKAATMDLNLDTICPIGDCIHLGPHEHSFLEERPRFDYTLVQTVLTCHQRLLDIAMVILDNGLRCSAGVAFMQPHDITFDVPSVRIGSLAISKSTAATVWMNLVRDSLESSANHVRNLPSILDAVRRPIEDQSDIIRLQSRVIIKRTEMGNERMKELRSTMAAFDLVGA